MNTFLRRIAILEFLRHSALPRSTEEVLEHLRGRGYLDDGERDDSLRRLVQRDMNALLGKDEDGAADNAFGLEVQRGAGKSLLWSLDKYAELRLDFEKLPRTMAMALAVLHKHFQVLLPRETTADLEGLFQRAEARLEQSERKVVSRHYRQLRDAVEFFQRGQSLRPPSFDPESLDTIYQAIVRGQRLAFVYRERHYQVSPYGVAFLLPKIYLVARNEAGEFRHFLVHRMRETRLLVQSYEIEPGFSLKRYLEQGAMDLLLDRQAAGIVRLVLDLDTRHEREGFIEDLQDYPLAEDQTLERVEAYRWRLSVATRITVQLRHWILGLGACATVIEPIWLRGQLRAELSRTLQNYLD